MPWRSSYKVRGQDEGPLWMPRGMFQSSIGAFWERRGRTVEVQIGFEKNRPVGEAFEFTEMRPLN